MTRSARHRIEYGLAGGAFLLSLGLGSAALYHMADAGITVAKQETACNLLNEVNCSPYAESDMQLELSEKVILASAGMMVFAGVATAYVSKTQSMPTNEGETT